MLLKNAFLDLMSEGAASKITVKALCDKAELNRSTFYLHYYEPNDILKEIEDEIMGSLSEYLSRIGSQREGDEVEYIIRLLDYIKDNDKVFRTLLLDNDNPYFTRKFVKTALDRMFSVIKFTPDEATGSFVYSYIVNGCLAIMTDWLRSGYALPVRELSELCASLAIGTLKQYSAVALNL